MIPDWVIQTVVACAIAVTAWFLRGLREDVDKNDRERRSDIDTIKLDLAKNYVTHRQLRGLRNDLRKALEMMNYLQLELARHFKFKPFTAVPDASGEFDRDQENEHDGD